MLFRGIPFFLVLMFFSGTCVGDPPSPLKPLFFEVQRGGSCSYLLGTIHFGISSREFPPHILERLRQSKVVITENDVRKMKPQQVEDVVALPDGTKLSSLVSAKSWTFLSEALNQKVPLDRLETLRPGAVLLLYLHRHARHDSMDLEFLDTAGSLNIPILELETGNQQITVFQQLLNPSDLNQEIAMLEQVLQNHASADKAQRQFMDIVWSGEMGQLDTVVTSMMPPLMLQQTLYDRNIAWMPRISEALSGGNAFIIVGAAHLVGEKGIIKLLEGESFKITRDPRSVRQNSVAPTSIWVRPRYIL